MATSRRPAQRRLFPIARGPGNPDGELGGGAGIPNSKDEAGTKAHNQVV
jgi:hypothetical protein